MGLTASQTVPGGLVSPAGYEDPLAAGLNPHPIAPSLVHPSLSFDGSAYGPVWGWSYRSQAGPVGWSTSFDQAWPCRSFFHYPLQRLSQSATTPIARSARSAWWQSFSVSTRSCRTCVARVYGTITITPRQSRVLS